MLIDKHNRCTAALNQHTRTLLSGVFALILLWFPNPAFCRPGIDAILHLMLLNGKKTPLRGRQVVMSTHPGLLPRTVTNRVVRCGNGHSLAICLDPASDRGKVASDDGVWNSAYNPKTHRVVYSRSIPPVKSEHDANRLIRLMHRNYRINIENQEVIAGRMCYRLSFTPYSPGFYTIQAWLDKSTGVVLSLQKSDGYNTLSLMIFASAEFPASIPASEATYKYPASAKKTNNSRSKLIHNLADARKQAKFDICLPISMPGGYEFEQCEIMSINGVRTACLRYTDGLSPITIFETPAREKRPASYRATRTTIDSLGDVTVDYANSAINVVVMGNGSADLLTDVAQSMDPWKEHAIVETLASNYRTSRVKIDELRHSGLGLDAIAAILYIHTSSGRSLSSLAAMCRDGWHWKSMAERFRVPVKIVNSFVLQLLRY